MKTKQIPMETKEQVMQAALRSLDCKDFSREELRQKLSQKGAPRELTALVIEELTDRGYLDDRRVAENLTGYRKALSPRGRAFVRRELTSKGIDDELIEEMLQEVYSEEDEEALIRQLIEPEARQLAQLTDPVEKRKAREKILRRLAAKGFNISLCLELLTYSWQPQD